MQLINAPGKLVLPFAASGAKNAIPVASQIGIVAGAASLTDGFPPLTRTPLAAGGVPPSGLDMNGIIYELSAILRWANAGAGYVYDGTFATDSNVGGYPKGARVLRSDGLGCWFNTTDNNTTDPEGVGAVAAGWVPDFTNGVAAVTMAGSNVTLTALEYGKPIIVISGLLTANLNLIFPSIAGEWSVINNTTGAYSITCKTAAGTGVVVNSTQAIVGDGANIYSAVNDAISLLGENVAHAAGTADALTAAFTPAPHSWPDGVPFFVRAASANATTTPTFTPNSGTLTAKTIVKGANGALAAGDIAGAGHWLVLQYDATLDAVVLLNPAKGIVSSGLPVGLPLMWPTPVAPSWALVRDGAAITRAAYAALFAALCPTRNGTTTNGSAAITGLSSTTDLYVGMPVEGTGIPAGATVASITSATAITISANATASGTVAIRLFYFGYGSGGSATTFGVPDDRGLFERGLDTGAANRDRTNVNGTTTNGSAAITGLSSTVGIFVGQAISGTGIPGGATVASITSATAITISANATASGTVTLTFTGRQCGSYQADTNKAHTHTIPGQFAAGSGSDLAVAYGGSSASGNTLTTSVGDPEARGKNRAYLPIIVY